MSSSTWGHGYARVEKGKEGKSVKKSHLLRGYTSPWEQVVSLGWMGGIYIVFVAFMAAWDFTYIIDANTIQVAAPFSLAITMDGLALLCGIAAIYLCYRAHRDKRHLRRLGYMGSGGTLDEKDLIDMHYSHANAHGDYNLFTKAFLVYLFGWIFWTCFNYGTFNQNFLLYTNKLTTYPSPLPDNTVASIYLFVILKAYQAVSLALDIVLLAVGIDRTLAIATNDKVYKVMVSVNNAEDRNESTELTPGGVERLGAREDSAIELADGSQVQLTKEQMQMNRAFITSII